MPRMRRLLLVSVYEVVHVVCVHVVSVCAHCGQNGYGIASSLDQL